MPAAKPKVTKICKQCGIEFSVCPSIDKRGGGTYCSHACHTEGFAHGNKATGERNHMWKGGIIPTGHGYLKEKVSNDAYVPQHILVAERALGRLLSRKHPVHHVDQNRANNKNSNLVICQDAAYHNLLHKRMRVVRAGGDPNRDKICAKCHACLDRETWFSKDRGSLDEFTNVCRECCAKLQVIYREKRKTT